MVRDVPAKVCNQCGEDWIGIEIAKQLERITDDAKRNRTLVNVFSMADVDRVDVVE